MESLNIAYLQLKSEFLGDMTLDTFKEWIYLDEFGNKQEEIKFREDIERELVREERYDLLIFLQNNLHN